MKSRLLGIGLVLVTFIGFGQNNSDSLKSVQQDSLLLLQQDQSKNLLRSVDSLKLADSLEQLDILQQIENLTATDNQKKIELQNRLDSIKNAKLSRDLILKNKIDSLRANTKGVPVIFHGDTLFLIYSKLGPFRPSDRANNIVNRLQLLLDENAFDPEKVQVFENEESSDILHEDVIILSITEKDAFWVNKPRKIVAEEYKNAIIIGVTKYQEDSSFFNNMKRLGILLLVVLIFFLIIRYLNKGFTWLNKKLIAKSKHLLKGIKIKDYEVLSAEREVRAATYVLKLLKWIVIIILIYLLLPVIFSIFPATKGIAGALFGYILSPIKSAGKAFVGYIPELITITVIVIIARYILKFLRFLSNEVAIGKLQLPGFYADWAKPTFNLVKVLIYAFTFIIIFPYLPGSDSPVFQGVSVFLGVLISLGSSSAIGNLVAGLVITYMRPFKKGDRVKIGEVTGDVLEKTMLVTRIRTIKNEEITIPNAAILNGSTVNYSNSAEKEGLILHTTVTIGYDVPWKKVHELLIKSALTAEGIVNEPKPFILQTSLDDFYVSYQLNAYTRTPQASAVIYSNIHSNIQDNFNEGGVEILSPHYRAARDGNMVTIPADYLPKDYVAPSFNVKVDKEK